MSLLTLIKSYVPSFKKTDLEESLLNIHKDYMNIIIPMYSLLLSKKPDILETINSKELNIINDIFRRAYSSKINSKGIPVKEIHNGLKNIAGKLIGELSELSEGVLTDTVNMEGLTVKQMLLLQTVDHLSFIGTYSSDLLHYGLKLEVESLGDERSDVSKYVREYLYQEATKYATLIDYYGTNASKVVNLIKTTPEVFYNDTNSDTVESVHKLSKNKLFQLSNTAMVNGVRGMGRANPLFHIGMLLTDLRVFQYNVLSSQKKLMEIRLVELEAKRNNENTPELEKSIDYYEKSIVEKSKKLREIEDQYNANHQ